MTEQDMPNLALIVARNSAAAEELLGAHGVHVADIGPPPSPTVPHLAVAVDDESRQVVARLAGTHGWLVLLSPHASYRRAGTLLLLATRLPTTRRVLGVEELLVYQVLAATSDDEQEAVIQDVLGPVLSLPEAIATRLLSTLEALHWNEGSAKATARALGLHSKTVLNRLRRFEGLTGLCLDRPPDRLRVDVALYLLRVRGRLARVEVVHSTTMEAVYNRGNGAGASRMGWVQPAAAG